MPVGGVDRTGNQVRTQDARAAEAQANNDRRRVQNDNAQQAQEQKTTRGQNADVRA